MTDKSLDLSKKKLSKGQKKSDAISPSIALYDSDNLELWADTHPEMNYLKSLIQNGISPYIQNISAKYSALKLGKDIFPLLITTDNFQDSYVCSPYGNYISLGIEWLQTVKNRWLRQISHYGLKSLGYLIKKGRINSVIYFNHSLLSTDLQPNTLTESQIKTAVAFLKEKFPNHTIIFRSINAETGSDLKRCLKASGFKMLASRQIFLTDTKNPELLQTRIIKSDLKLWREREYDVVSYENFSGEDEERALELYQLLAIRSHSEFNPQITKRFLQLANQHSSFQMKGLKKNGKIEGVVGYYVKENILHCCFFGYDKSNKQNSTLMYRLLSTLLLLEAAKNGNIFHQSAGASFFKSVRRAVGHIEYQALYSRHLPMKQKLVWHFLRLTMNTFAVPFMKKY